MQDGGFHLLLGQKPVFDLVPHNCNWATSGDMFETGRFFSHILSILGWDLSRSTLEDELFLLLGREHTFLLWRTHWGLGGGLLEAWVVGPSTTFGPNFGPKCLSCCSPVGVVGPSIALGLSLEPGKLPFSSLLQALDLLCTLKWEVISVWVFNRIFEMSSTAVVSISPSFHQFCVTCGPCC